MIEFDGIPTLSDPVMIAAFEGWNDAGESASATITHLREVWGAELITEFDSEDYYDYQVNRPDISVDSAGVRQLEWPTTRIYLARVPLFPRDVVLIGASSRTCAGSNSLGRFSAWRRNWTSPWSSPSARCCRTARTRDLFPLPDRHRTPP